MKNRKRKCIYIILILVLIVVRHIICINNGYYTPEYPYKNISYLLSKETISDDEYSEIFKYTGVAPVAAKSMMENNNSDTLKTLNKLYFTEFDYDKNYIFFPVTFEESSTQIVPLVPLKKGDVLITFNTATLDWRHGHTAIVIDDGDTILEHMSIGHTSCLTPARRWSSYPGFAVLRHKNQQISESAAEYAMNNLVDINYSIFSGIIDKDKSNNDRISASHCSHIVWQAFKAAGSDIDYNGGQIVTPNDIFKSREFDIVQIFGIKPGKRGFDI